MDRLARVPVLVVAGMIALVATATGNLSMLGIGAGSFLYDPMALPRLVIGVVLTCTAWALWGLSVSRGGVKLRVNLVWGLLAALALWAGVATAFSPHRALAVLGQSERLEGLVTMMLYALVYGIALQVVHRVSDARRLAEALGVAAIGLSVYGLLQFAGLDPANYAHEGFGFSARRAFATFGNPNFLAGFLVLALPVVAALALEAGSRGRRMAWAAGSFVVGSALFLTFTRGAWLAALVEGAAIALIWRFRRVEPGIRLSRGVIVVGVTVAVALIATSLSLTGELNVAERISSAFTKSDSTGERLLMAGVAVDAVAERPLVGYGPDAFLPAFRAHRTDAYVGVFGEDATVNNAHSWILQYLVTLGIPGALLLVAVLILSLLVGRPRASAPGDLTPRSGDLLMDGIWVGCLGLMVHLAFNVGVIGATVPLFAMLGAIAAPRARSIVVPVMGARATLGVFAVLALVAVVASATLLRADAEYLASRRAYHGESGGNAVVLARGASGLNTLSVKYSRGLAQATARDVETAIMNGDSIKDVRNLYDIAFTDFESTLALSPNDYASLAWLAALDARVGEYLQDEELLGSAVAVAQAAASLDRQHAAVGALANGDTSEAAILSAASVPPLP